MVTLTIRISAIRRQSGRHRSSKVHAAGLIIRDLPLLASNFRSTLSLSDYLKAENIVAIAGIDTRKLTRILREKGAQGGAILVGTQGNEPSAAQALELARSFPGLAGMDLAKVVSSRNLRIPAKRMDAGCRLWQLADADANTRGRLRLRRQAQHPAHADGTRCKVTVLPAQATAADALPESGRHLPVERPGDPNRATSDAATKELIEKGIPTFGICLGHQIMRSLRRKDAEDEFGHTAPTTRCADLETKQVLITSQNHGFAVDAATCPRIAA